MGTVILIPVGIIAFFAGARVIRSALYDRMSPMAGISFSFIGIPLVLAGIGIVGGVVFVLLR